MFNSGDSSSPTSYLHVANRAEDSFPDSAFFICSWLWALSYQSFPITSLISPPTHQTRSARERTESYSAFFSLEIRTMFGSHLFCPSFHSFIYSTTNTYVCVCMCVPVWVYMMHLLNVRYCSMHWEYNSKEGFWSSLSKWGNDEWIDGYDTVNTCYNENLSCAHGTWRDSNLASESLKRY